MKHLNFILFAFISILLCSCAVEKEKYTDEQKNYVLPEQYEKISQPGLIYVSHISNNFVSVFDPAEMKLVGKVPCGSGADISIVSGDRTKGYIANFHSNDVTVYDTKTNKTLATVKSSEHPSALLEIPEQKKILITHQSSSGINVLNTEDNSITSMGEICTGYMYYLNEKGKIYVPQIFTPYIFILDPVTFHITKRIETPGRPMAMAFTSDNKFGYLANFDSAEVVKIDINKDSVILKIKNIPSPRGITVTPDNKYVLVTNVVDNTLSIIDINSDSLIKTLYGLRMPTWVITTKDGKYAVVSNQGANSLAIVDLSQLEIIKSIPTAENPISLFIDNR
ncbi:MAG: YncE family protein [Ignavibacteria bacterium]